VITDAPTTRIAPKPIPKLRIGAIVVAVAAVGFTAWLLIHHFRSSSPAGGSTPSATSPAVTAATAAQLAAKAAALGRPIYWAGPQDGTTYELTQKPDGSTYVRYLPQGVAVGDPTPYLTIATYPLRSAFTDTTTASQRSGSVKLDVGAGAVAFYDSSRPTNVYEAFQGSSYQIEVFAPSAQQAQQVVTGGQIAPAGITTPPEPKPVAATDQTLAATVGAAGHPVFWLGSRPGVKYEVTQLPNGRVYLRYLPESAKVGTDVAYLTVGTYPLKHAFAITSSAAKQPNVVKVPVQDGVAFYSKARPQSVYVAFRGVDEQIEIYDPTPSAVLPLVGAGKLVQVP
jgi:hypothetical protein